MALATERVGELGSVLPARQAALRAGGREPQQDREGRGRWVQGGESRLFDRWTFGPPPGRR